MKQISSPNLNIVIIKMFVMKNLAIIGLVLLIGCAKQPITEFPESFEVWITDFRPYTEKGFFFSPYSYAGEHESIGSLRFMYNPEMEMVTIDGPKPKHMFEPVPSKVNVWESRSEPDRVLDLVYQACIDLGADALVDFRLSREYLADGFETITITGYAIKRIYPVIN